MASVLWGLLEAQQAPLHPCLTRLVTQRMDTFVLLPSVLALCMVMVLF